MPRRLLLALLVLVAAPLVLLGWVSAAAMRDSQKQAQKQIASLLRARMIEIDQATSELFETYERRISAALDKTSTPIETLQGLRRSDPVVRQGIFVSSDGQILFPKQPSLDDPDAVALYSALPGMISGRPALGKDLQSQADAQLSPLQTAQSSPRQVTKYSSRGTAVKPIAKLAIAGDSLWQVWYLDQGMQLILWLPRTDGTAVGVILERPRWASDLMAMLPDSVLPDSSEFGRNAIDTMPGFTALVDEAKQTVYRWGDEGECGDQPIVTLPMSSPLTAWQWEFHNTEQLVPKTSVIPLLLSLVGIGVVLLALGAYVLSSVQRQMRTARNRVSFAGQVSHELRTPLTNIRLYAELAESDLDSLPESETRESVHRRLKVIDTESKRLGRLVTGVLEMMRQGKKQQGPRLALANPDQLIDETLGQFTPSFEKAGIQIHRDTAADQNVKMDADIFEMVLVNLLSNVEKYAADGRYVLVRSRIENETLIVGVADRGPGVSRVHQRLIFRPFTRLDDSISAPSGTGIGLTIARNAAMRHHGHLDLIPSDKGACFELRIPLSTARCPVDSVSEKMERNKS